MVGLVEAPLPVNVAVPPGTKPPDQLLGVP
jgi:hypothetical protein